MSSRNINSNWSKFAVIAVTFIIAAVTAPATVSRKAVSGTQCKNVNGHVEEQVVAQSPTLITTGKVIGTVQGEYNSTLLSATPTTQSGVILFNTTSIVHTNNGDLYLNEAGGFDLNSPGNYADLLTVTGGNGEFAGSTGQIFVTGNLNLATGTGRADYRGEICTP